MINRHPYLICILVLNLIAISLLASSVCAEPGEVEISGVVKEAGTGLPLAQVAISVSSTGNSTASDEQGVFTIMVPDLQSEILVDLPGYNRRDIYLNGREVLEVILVSDRYASMDNPYNTHLGPMVQKDAIIPLTVLTQRDLDLDNTTSFDQTLQGKVPGMHIIQQSGMPGHRTFMNLRGFSSLFANTEPVLFIDGMIHEYSYVKNSLIEGFTLNPMDVVDIDDISDISVLKAGNTDIGSIGSNGVMYVNTEQKAEASTVIKFATQVGITLVPEKHSLLDTAQYEQYFRDMLSSQELSPSEIDAMYPWLNGDNSTPGYYKYHNSTDWQDEIFRTASVSKFHFFIKGGDEIATYNVSTGYLAQQGIIDNSRYTRFNLRINGKVNITDRFSIAPNAKLSIADNNLPNQGPSAYKSAIFSALLKPPIMAPIARDEVTGVKLTYLDDVGDFGVSNPVAIVENAIGENRNYHFLSSLKAEYSFNPHFSISTLIGIDFNNARENIFLPDLGLVEVDSASNSPGDYVYEFRSTQNHTILTYSNRGKSSHSVTARGGLHYINNIYKYDKSIDLNTPSDDFKSLGDGAQYTFLRSTLGDNRGLVWLSLFGNVDYGYRDKYLLSLNLSYDANSANNQNNRYNFYPSVAAAWRLSSESFLKQANWLEDLKLRVLYSLTGNIFSTVYDYSKLYYTDRRMNSIGVLTREAIPNKDLELEKKNTLNAGLDISIFRQLINVRIDYFNSSINNMVIRQELPSAFGFTDYYDNGGQLKSSGFEVSFDTRMHAGDLVWTLGGMVSNISTEVSRLDFLNDEVKYIITKVQGAELITSVGNPVNVYYGYETDGILSEFEAGTITGPKGLPMEAGDIRFVDQDGNGIINDADKTIIGDPNPALFGSLFTSLGFRNIELSVNLIYSMGNDLFSYRRYRLESMSDYHNQSSTILNRWSPENPGASLPRASYGDPTGNTVFSDRWIEDGSYIRLGQLTLSYNLPPITGVYKGAVLYVTAKNLFTINNYSGYDPEFIYMNNPFYMGIDYGMMPLSKLFVIGLKMNF